MKGIVLAGGTGSRLRPITMGVSKHLLPVYDKPMIYYPLSVLMLAGIREILVISTPVDIHSYKRLLGDGKHIGLQISYETQDQADGIPSAFLIGEDFIKSDSVCLILGDNIFFGQDFTPKLSRASSIKQGATLFCCRVGDPARFGVVTLDDENRPLRIVEKPTQPETDFAVTGLYFYGNEVIRIAKSLVPSRRGELEITDLNNLLIDERLVNVELLGRGFTWIDAGTHDSLIAASSMVQSIEKRQGYKIACLEEIAFINGWVNKEILLNSEVVSSDTDYGRYLLSVVG
jgi:glucose-1-phosphate thymidylyltransferase